MASLAPLNTPIDVRSLGRVFGEHVFAHDGPSTWNSLLEYLLAIANPVGFIIQPQMHFFRLAFKV